jgi:hypothetical protein
VVGAVAAQMVVQVCYPPYQYYHLRVVVGAKMTTTTTAVRFGAMTIFVRVFVADEDKYRSIGVPPWQTAVERSCPIAAAAILLVLVPPSFGFFFAPPS